VELSRVCTKGFLTVGVGLLDFTSFLVGGVSMTCLVISICFESLGAGFLTAEDDLAGSLLASLIGGFVDDMMVSLPMIEMNLAFELVLISVSTLDRLRAGRSSSSTRLRRRTAIKIDINNDYDKNGESEI